MDAYEKENEIKRMLFDLTNAPVMILPIADKLGLDVYSAKDWSDNISGMIVKDEGDGETSKSGYKIYVNGNHTETRRRFTIAHEIAHYVLHEHLIGDGITEDALYRSRLSNFIESEANKLAANILMPTHLVEEAVKTEVRLEQLAKKFFVSPQAMAIRLSRLNIIID